MRRLHAMVLLGLLASAPAFAWNWLGADWAWQGHPISDPFKLNSLGWPSNMARSQIEQADRNAQLTWTLDGGAAFHYNYELWNNNGWLNDGSNAMYFLGVTHSGTALAYADTWSSGIDMIECDITFVDANAWGPIYWSAASGGPASWEYDVEDTMTHELGHCLGLDHSTSPSAIMYAYANQGVAIRGLSGDDMAGLQAIYGTGTPADLVPTDAFLSELTGDGDNQVEAGETWDFWVVLSNVGDSRADTVGANISTTDSDVTFTWDNTGWLSMGPDDTSLPQGSFTFDVDGACATDHTVDVTLNVWWSTGTRTWPLSFDVDCGPDPSGDPLTYGDHQVTEISGDGDDRVEPGETWTLDVALDNPRSAAAVQITGVASTTSSALGLTDPGAAWSNISAGGRGWMSNTVTFTVDANCPASVRSGQIDLLITDDSGTSDISVDLDLVCSPSDADVDGFEVPIDCDDNDPNISPAAVELCDGVDNDCDGTIDTDARDATVWYPDDDADGFGFPVGGTAACTAPSGHVADASDCDDDDATVHPGASESCDGRDEDCNGSVDDNATDLSTWYPDDDGDGFGVPGAATDACQRPSGHAPNDTDCDDQDADVHPGAEDPLYDGVDSNCDGLSDFDGDGDRHDSSAYGGDDCNDEVATQGPGTPDADCANGPDELEDERLAEADAEKKADARAKAEAEAGCGCAHPSTPTGALFLAGLAALLVRRRGEPA